MYDLRSKCRRSIKSCFWHRKEDYIRVTWIPGLFWTMPRSGTQLDKASFPASYFSHVRRKVQQSGAVHTHFQWDGTLTFSSLWWTGDEAGAEQTSHWHSGTTWVLHHKQPKKSWHRKILVLPLLTSIQRLSRNAIFSWERNETHPIYLLLSIRFVSQYRGCVGISYRRKGHRHTCLYIFFLFFSLLSLLLKQNILFDAHYSVCFHFDIWIHHLDLEDLILY